MLQPAHCRQRQRRLLDVMHRERLDGVVVGDARHVYYLSGHYPFWLHEGAFVLFADGRSVLFCANEMAPSAVADDIRPFDATWMGTQRMNHASVIAASIVEFWPSRARVALDASPVSSCLSHIPRDGDRVLADPILHQLRRKKDPDELALMRKAIDCTRAMHERARQIIRPGVSELHVFNALHAAAVESAGEPLSPAHLGNDFRCAAPGGAPRNDRRAEAGELYILDLGPAYRGYFADNSRVYAVDGKPTDAQVQAWETIVDVFPIVEGMAKPGVHCRDLFTAVDDHYRANVGHGIPHHLGHGVGLSPHEFPHLNPRWDDVLEEGDIFTCEPGLYSDALNAGLRIENQYLVTATGVQNLTPFPMELM